MCWRKYKSIERFLLVNAITSAIPNTSIDLSRIQIPNGFSLADEDFHKAEEVQVLLGASIFFEVLCIGQIKFEPNKPIWQKARFGWVISGPYSNKPDSSEISCKLSISNEDLHKQVERFWSVEDVANTKRFTAEEIECEQHFVDIYKCGKNGRFEVSLPFRQNFTQLGDSQQTAITRFERLEKRLQKNRILRNDYHNFLQEYQSLGHMTEIDPDNDTAYSTITKLRVVFDASAKTSSGLSLNDVLKVGPLIQRDLTAIVLSFRMHNVVFTANVEKMYCQINVNQEETNYRRILWRKEPDDT
ncbi:hypothetical protein Trydic_g20665 [Trypoxylus dichotomus]